MRDYKTHYSLLLNLVIGKRSGHRMEPSICMELITTIERLSSSQSFEFSV